MKRNAQIDRKHIKQLMFDIYMASPTGGNLHIVLEDLKTSVKDLMYCKNVAIPTNYYRSNTAAELRLVDMLLEIDGRSRGMVVKYARRDLIDAKPNREPEGITFH